jgi:pimeloyl-ACP methyl ester carboxylesterase
VLRLKNLPERDCVDRLSFCIFSNLNLPEMSRTQKYISLSDGRRLGYAEFGDRQGKPLFYCHGFPGSRLEARLADRISCNMQIRFVGIDRPGYGLSSFKAARTISDWADDVAQLADALGVDRFSILGVSGGGPYVAACAHQIPHRINWAGIICGMGPIDTPGLTLGMPWIYRRGLLIAGRFPKIATALYPFSGFFFRHYPKQMLSIISKKVAEPDKMALNDPDLIDALCLSFQEAFCSSLRWPAADVVLYSRPWGFDLADIRIPVYLWHGEKDRIVPPEMGRYIAQALPDCRATFYVNEGHFSIILNRMKEIWQIF